MNFCKKLATYTIKDIVIHYWIDENQIPSISITPSQSDKQTTDLRQLPIDDPKMSNEVCETSAPAHPQPNLVQLKLVGDAQPIGFSGGSTMTNSASIEKLRFVSQSKEQNTITTELADDRGLRAKHKLTTWENQPFIEVRIEISNESDSDIHLEMLASFCLGGLSPFQPDQGSGKYQIHRFMSAWSAEGRHECKPIEELNLEKSWSGYGVRSLRFGQTGSMPVKGWFPFVAFEDTEYGALWGAQIAHPGSWQLEVFRRNDSLNLSGGLADRETGHWMKTLKPGQHFSSPPAILSCCTGDIQDLTNRMVRYQHLGDEHLPETEQTLPIIFNDWCTTWGQPSEENILKLANRIEGMGINYLVMDDGWFNDERGCQKGLGDWNIDTKIYPNGFKKLHDDLHNKGFVSGVWFELENCTQGSEIYEMTEHLLHRDGHVLQSGSRRFLDFRDPWVLEYLDEKVIQMLKRNNIKYIKTDYNDTIGLGCDGAESLGEGLRQHLENVQKFYARMRKEIPELKIEICSSGGHRLEPSWMALGSMGGFSDSHEGLDIPIIAANTQMMIPARKNQIWAVLRKTDSTDRLHYSLAATFLGRMCLSGDIHELNTQQMDTVQKGIDMYHKVKPAIKQGSSRRHGSKLLSYTHPEGWQAVVRTHHNEKEAFVVMHTFANAPELIQIPLSGQWEIADTYANDNMQLSILDGELTVGSLKDFQGAVISLSRK